jgi:23S rRNA (guanosine2251-2'-O)-methyltransferase
MKNQNEFKKSNNRQRKNAHTSVKKGNDKAVVYGKNPVTELLKSGAAVDTVYLSDSLNERLQAYYAALAKQSGAVVKKADSKKLTNLCNTNNHQGIVAFAADIEYRDIEDILSAAREKKEDPFIVLCDGIEDPHNLGAIIRSAFLMGAHGVVIPKRGGVSVTATVIKTSAGAALHLPVARVVNMAETVRTLKKENIFVWARDMKSTPIYNDDLKGPIAIVIGSEGKGVSRLVKKLCDGTVSIPIDKKDSEVDSLNASVAAGIIMYEISRQRG